MHKPDITINKDLMSMQSNGLQTFNKLKLKGNKFILGKLIDAIKGKEAPPQTIMAYSALKDAKLKNKKGIDIAITILNKYNRTLMNFRNFYWRIVSNQKINSDLKALVRMAKINKKLFIHI